MEGGARVLSGRLVLALTQKRAFDEKEMRDLMHLFRRFRYNLNRDTLKTTLTPHSSANRL